MGVIIENLIGHFPEGKKNSKQVPVTLIFHTIPTTDLAKEAQEVTEATTNTKQGVLSQPFGIALGE